MRVSREEAAEIFNVTVEKLEKIRACCHIYTFCYHAVLLSFFTGGVL
jgi:hypothetical protein